MHILPMGTGNGIHLLTISACIHFFLSDSNIRKVFVESKQSAWIINWNAKWLIITDGKWVNWLRLASFLFLRTDNPLPAFSLPWLSSIKIDFDTIYGINAHSQTDFQEKKNFEIPALFYVCIPVANSVCHIEEAYKFSMWMDLNYMMVWFRW